MLLEMLFAAVLAADGPPAPVHEALAPGVSLIAGAMPNDRGPDGNTVVFEAPGGLIVVDTGRHASHSDRILALARARGRPIAAIINTHWHLDHASGNRRIKAAFPEARIFATSAVDRALAPGGFLERNIEPARRRLAETDGASVEREERENFLATMEASRFLRPEVAITQSGRRRFAGARFEVRVSAGAVTDADIWLYEPRSRIVVLGDLATLPAPFFETACPEAWRAELDRVWERPFRLAVPGHGAPMSRDGFNTYRLAFGAFLDCVNSDAAADVCASAWAAASAPISSESERAQAVEYASYYVAFLRENGGRSPSCLH